MDAQERLARFDEIWRYILDDVQPEKRSLVRATIAQHTYPAAWDEGERAAVEFLQKHPDPTMWWVMPITVGLEVLGRHVSEYAKTHDLGETDAYRHAFGGILTERAVEPALERSLLRDDRGVDTAAALFVLQRQKAFARGETFPPALAMARAGSLVATIVLRPFQGREDKTKALLGEAFRLIGATGADAIAYVDDVMVPPGSDNTCITDNRAARGYAPTVRTYIPGDGEGGGGVQLRPPSGLSPLFGPIAETLVEALRPNPTSEAPGEIAADLIQAGHCVRLRAGSLFEGAEEELTEGSADRENPSLEKLGRLLVDGAVDLLLCGWVPSIGIAMTRRDGSWATVYLRPWQGPEEHDRALSEALLLTSAMGADELVLLGDAWTDDNDCLLEIHAGRGTGSTIRRYVYSRCDGGEIRFDAPSPPHSFTGSLADELTRAVMAPDRSADPEQVMADLVQLGHRVVTSRGKVRRHAGHIAYEPPRRA
jgi:hypothetical protein